MRRVGCDKKHPSKNDFTEYGRRREIRRMAIAMRFDLDEINREFQNYAVLPWDHIQVPPNRMEWGYERIRRLAMVAPEAMHTILRRFVTGPPHNELFWLKRNEAKDCWKRILQEYPDVKKICDELDLDAFELEMAKKGFSKHKLQP